jgi:hypothetical protein
MPLDLNNYFVERRNQFHKSVYQKLFRSNPFKTLVPMSAFDLSEGRTPTVRTLTHELPSGYPTAMTEITVSNGTSNPNCNPTSTTIKRGEIQRTFKMFGTSFNTDTICLSDLKRAVDAAQTVAGFERALTEYLQVWWSDWYRLQNIAMVDNKVATRASGVISAASSTKGDFTDLTALPNDFLSWDHLKQIYWQLCRNGLADELAVGRDSKGRPIIPLYAGVGTIARLWTNSDTKEQVKFFDPAKNLEILGYDGAVNGFLPMVDLFPIRFGKAVGNLTLAELTLANTQYPTVNANATVGRTFTNSPAYGVAGVGAGRSEYEVATILGRQVWEAKYEPVDPTQFAGMKFDPVNYIGEFQWINQRTFQGDNDRGNLGYYLADVRAAAKPIFPELGYSILTKATDI